MGEQLKPAHKVVEVVDHPYRKICETLLQYNVDKPESSIAQIRCFEWKNEDEKFQQIVCENYEFESFIHLLVLEVMNSVYDKGITNEPIRNVQEKVLATIYSSSFFFLIESRRYGKMELRETSF